MPVSGIVDVTEGATGRGGITGGDTCEEFTSGDTIGEVSPGASPTLATFEGGGLLPERRDPITPL